MPQKFRKRNQMNKILTKICDFSNENPLKLLKDKKIK